MPFIASDNAFAIVAVCLAVSAVGIRMETTSVGRRVSGAIIAIVLAALLSNGGLIPRSAPTYDFIWTYLLPFAIALFMMNTDIPAVLKTGGRTLIAFAFGALGTIIGCLAGAALLDLGNLGPEYAAVFSATFTGGSLNFAATADAIGFRDSSPLAAAFAVDNAFGVLYFVGLGTLARWSAIRSWLPGGAPDAPAELASATPDRPGELGLLDMLAALAVAACACALGTVIAARAGFADYSILCITIVILVIAATGRTWLRRLRSPETMAMAFMYLFFVMLGAGADFGAVFATSAALPLFVLLIVAFHVAFLSLGAKLFGLSYAETVIASSACIGGPPIAIAFAALFNWRQLATVGAAAGVLGYAIGTFVGVGVYAIVQTYPGT